jgi:simple sugar transport system permease protein
MGGRGTLMGTLVGVLIFGMLTNILQLHNITTNVQLVLKGMIIVIAVLLQERSLGQILAPLHERVRAWIGRTMPAGAPEPTEPRETET